MDSAPTQETPQGVRFPILSSIALVLANFVPVAGVLFLGWDIGTLMFLFWSENAIIGVYNVLRILACQPGSIIEWIVKIPVVFLFLVHYGIFCFVHGMFVVAMFMRDGSTAELGEPDLPAHLWLMLQDPSFALAVAGLVVSHGISFVSNFLRGGEYLTAVPKDLMTRPYGRVVALHLTLLFGGYLSLQMESPIGALLFLTLTKIGLDLYAHWTERQKLGSALGSLTHAVLDMDGVNQRLEEMKKSAEEDKPRRAKNRKRR